MALNSFDRGLEAEEIVTIVEEAGKTLMCVKFKGQPRPELIPAEVANRRIPQMVIEFYVEHMSYELPGQGKEAKIKKEKNWKNSSKRKPKPEEQPRHKKKTKANIRH